MSALQGACVVKLGTDGRLASRHPELLAETELGI
jgi:hypothetical protein